MLIFYYNLRMFESVLFKVKTNKLNVWLSWCTELSSRKDEAIETLIEENEIFESSSNFRVGGDYFVIMSGYSEKELLPSSAREINHIHKNKKRECLEFVEKISADYFINTLKQH